MSLDFGRDRERKRDKRKSQYTFVCVYVSV
jgi:hypothetical protein